MSGLRVRQSVRGGLHVFAFAPVLAACVAPSLTPAVDERARLIDAARKSGNPGFAVLIAQRHVEENPDDFSAHAAYGRLLVELRECGKAIPVLRRSASLAQGEGGDNEHTRLLAKSYLQCRKFDKVLGLARRHEEQHPDDVEMLNMQGVALDNLGDRPGAQSAYRKALSVQPSQKVSYNLALSLLLSGQTDQSLKLLEGIRADAVDDDISERSIIILEALGLAKGGRRSEAKALLSSVVSDGEAERLLSRVK